MGLVNTENRICNINDAPPCNPIIPTHKCTNSMHTQTHSSPNPAVHVEYRQCVETRSCAVQGESDGRRPKYRECIAARMCAVQREGDGHRPEYRQCIQVRMCAVRGDGDGHRPKNRSRVKIVSNYTTSPWNSVWLQLMRLPLECDDRP